MKVQKGARKTRKGAKAARNIKKLKQTYDKLKFHGVKELMRTMKEVKKYLIQKASRKCKELKAVEPSTDASTSELTKHLEQIQAIKAVPQDILVNIATSLLAGDKPHPDANAGVVPLITSHKRFVTDLAVWKEKLSEVKKPKRSNEAAEDVSSESAMALPKSKNMLLSLDDPDNAPVKKKRPPKNKARTDPSLNKYIAPMDREHKKPRDFKPPPQQHESQSTAPTPVPTRIQPERHAPRQMFAPNTDKHTKHMPSSAPKKGELHPSWVAKQQQKVAISISAAPAGKKIVFD